MNPYQQQGGGYPGQQSYLHNIGFSNGAPQSFGNPIPMPGYPPSVYPPAQGYPTSNSGYPPQPPSSSGYPATGPGYPPSSGYPQSNQSYPSSNPGYPPSNPGYSSSTPSFPSSNPGYPGSQSIPSSYQGYPPANQSQPSGGYPTQSAQGYPQAQSGYPGQKPGYPGSTSGYPSAQTQVHANQSYGQPQTTSANVPKCRPTVVPANPFNPRDDAAVLRKAMKGFGTDEKSIIQVLTRRSNEQRLRIAFEFKTLYGKDLVDDLKSETSGKFEDLVVALMTPLPQFYAKELHDALDGIGTDEDVLIEVMCTMSNHEIAVIKQAYTAMYGKLLEDDLRGDTSGNFKRLMTSLCMGNRSEDFHVDQDRAREDARSLLQAGELRLGTDESAFNAVLCSRSFTQLAAVFAEYQFLTGHDIDDAIKAEFSGDMEKALRAIVKIVRNKPLFFAERLHKSMKGLGTNDRQLIRVMVTRAEVDLADISDMFNAKYGETLQSWIEGDCSGHYKKCLLGLLGLY